MFSTLDRQFADSIVVYHLWNASERLTELAQYVAYCTGVRCLGRYLHVHEPATASTHRADNQSLHSTTNTKLIHV